MNLQLNLMARGTLRIPRQHKRGVRFATHPEALRTGAIVQIPRQTPGAAAAEAGGAEAAGSNVVREHKPDAAIGSGVAHADEPVGVAGESGVRDERGGGATCDCAPAVVSGGFVRGGERGDARLVTVRLLSLDWLRMSVTTRWLVACWCGGEEGGQTSVGRVRYYGAGGGELGCLVESDVG